LDRLPGTPVSIETIRFYERRGLIDDPPLKKSGYRQYPAETVERIGFIRMAKKLGFTLKEIGEILHLKLESPSTSTCDEVRKLA
jgi:MerR family mercuric resistance operon transcriptional regulator